MVGVFDIFLNNDAILTICSKVNANLLYIVLSTKIMYNETNFSIFGNCLEKELCGSELWDGIMVAKGEVL